MKPDRKMVIWMLASALSGFGAQAVTPDGSGRSNSEPAGKQGAGIQSNNPAPGLADTQQAGGPYLAIVDRNVFNLHPPPPPIDPSELAKKTQVPKLTLNGITTILGKKIVFLTMPATKPGGPLQSLMLAEGQAEDEVEAKQIDEKAGVVKVNNHGEDQTLDFEHDGTKPAPPPGNPAAPAITIPPVPSMPPANTIPVPQPGVNVIRPLRTLPSRTTTPFSGGGSSSFGGSAMAGNSLNPSAAENQQPLTAEQAVLMVEAQRVKAMDEGDVGMSKILPPTDFTPEVTGQGPATQ